jgi:phage gpG-like protein
VIAISTKGVPNVLANMDRGVVAVRREKRVAMERVVRTVERDLKQRGLTGQKGSHPLFGVTGASGNSVGVRSGHLRRSIVSRVFDAAGVSIGVIGSPLPQAKVHEKGGVISGSPYLRIPTREMQTGAGVDRLAGQSARSLPNSFVFRSKAGNLWIAMRNGGQLVLAYLLKLQVKIRARRPFGATLDRNRQLIRDTFKRGGASITSAANGRR